MDISRYDVVRDSMADQFEYQLFEDLPPAPQEMRQFQTYTSWHEASRQIYSVAADYPYEGQDSHWVQKVNGAANESTPVYTNLIIPHPNVDNCHQVLTRALYRDDGSLFQIFNDGMISTLDLSTKTHTIVGNIYTSADFIGPTNTDAHVFDGNVLKSFIRDEAGNIFLVNTDTSVSPFTYSDPVQLKMTMNGFYKPIAAHMMNTNDAMPLSLAVVLSGTFDQLQFVNEETGELDGMINNMMDVSTDFPVDLICNTHNYDCDMWRTSAFDAKNHLLYIQTHVLDSGGGGEATASLAMMKIGFTQDLQGKWYPYINEAMSPMNFGYSGYNYVTITE